MNIEQIDIGGAANDGTGDDLRTAFEKINQNFTEVEINIDASTVAANVGTGIGIHKQKTVNILQFKSLAVGDKLAIADDGNTITISTDFVGKNFSVGSLTALGNISGNVITASMFSGSLTGGLIGRVYPIAPDSIIGAGNIVGAQPDPLTFFLLSNQTSSGTVAVFRKLFRNSQRLIQPSNNQPVAGQFLIAPNGTRSKILNVVDNGTTFTVTLEFNLSVAGDVNYTFSEEYLPARVDGVSVKDLSTTINTFDFGTLDNTYSSAFPYILGQIGLDMGTIISPTDVSVDVGTL